MLDQKVSEAAPSLPIGGTPRLIPVVDWNKHHDWPPQGGLRHLIHNERENGFSRCVRRIGRRVLIDEAAFFRWIEEANRPKKKTRRRSRTAPTKGEIRQAVDAINAEVEGGRHG